MVLRDFREECFLKSRRFSEQVLCLADGLPKSDLGSSQCLARTASPLCGRLHARPLLFQAAALFEQGAVD